MNLIKKVLETLTVTWTTMLSFWSESILGLHLALGMDWGEGECWSVLEG